MTGTVHPSNVNRRLATEKAIMWQQFCKDDYKYIQEELANNDLTRASTYQQIMAGDYRAMWGWLSQLI